MSKPQFFIGQLFDDSFKGMSPEEVKDNLSATAASVKEGEYTKKLTKEELDVAKSSLADVSIEIAKIDDEKKESMDEFKQRLATPKASHKSLLEAIKFKSVRKVGILYHVDDQETGVMYIFDETGICVDSRALLPQERQSNINSGVRKISEG